MKVCFLPLVPPSTFVAVLGPSVRWRETKGEEKWEHRRGVDTGYTKRRGR